MGCTWSIRTLMPSPFGVMETSAEITPVASAAACRNIGSDSIANTSASGASYTISWRSCMAASCCMGARAA